MADADSDSLLEAFIVLLAHCLLKWAYNPTGPSVVIWYIYKIGGVLLCLGYVSFGILNQKKVCF